ncbi:MAG TPA: hypothetical protein VNX01_07195 [Bacteroidia bacterium]|jgi:hypothetical protein|nr:hypothetical protein [Bacteroidia bacterium]
MSVKEILKYFIDYKMHVPVFFLAFFSLMFYFEKKRDGELWQYEFNGRVSDIIHDQKGIPTVTINKKQFYLDGGWGLSHSLNIGDSMIKRKNNMEITVIKNGTGQYKYYNSK